jgi:hypothetical protein
VSRISIVFSFLKLLKLGGDAGWRKAAEEQVRSSTAKGVYCRMRVRAKNKVSPGTFVMLDLTSSGVCEHGMVKVPGGKLQAGAGTLLRVRE